MATTKASRPQRVKNRPLPKVSKPETLTSKIDIAEPTKIGAKPPIGADPNFVEHVGLGKLKVVTAQGIKDDGNTEL